MDTLSTSTLRSDYPFQPWKTAASDEMHALIREVAALLDAKEQRQRARTELTQRTYERTVTALVCDVVHRHLQGPGRRVMVPLAKGALGSQVRPAPFMTEAFAPTVKRLAAPELGIALLDKGAKTLLGSVRSTIEIGPWLASRVDAEGLGFDDIGRDLALMGDPLILRSTKVNGKSRDLKITESPEVSRLRAEMDSINEWLADADIGWAGASESVDTRERYLRRIFNNASFLHGGRLYHGFWQSLPKQDRLDWLLIGGEAVVGLDFAQMGVRLAYGLVRATPPDGDLYQVYGAGGSREGVKKVLNALLSSGEAASRFPQGTKAYFPRRMRFKDVLEAISHRHPALVPLFGSATWPVLQYMESCVTVRSLLALKGQGVVALPIHDGLIVAQSNARVAKVVLETACVQVAGVEGRVEIEGVRTLSTRGEELGVDYLPSTKEEGQGQVGSLPSIGNCTAPYKKGG